MFELFINTIKSFLIENILWYESYTILPNSKNGGQSLCFFIRNENNTPIMIAKFFNYLNNLTNVTGILSPESCNSIDEYLDLLADSTLPYEISEITNIIYYSRRSYSRYIDVVKATTNLFPKLIISHDNLKIANSFYGFLIEEAVLGITLENKFSDIRLDGIDNIHLAINFLENIGLTILEYSKYGFVHRDISPDNIIISNNNFVIIDPGCIKILSKNSTSYGLLLGKLIYASPEQFIGQAVNVDFSSDLYSLGIITYQIITGTNPLAKYLSINCASPHNSILKNLDRELEDIFFTYCDYDKKSNILLYNIIKKLLQPEKNLRFESVASFMDAITILKEVYKND